MKVETALSSFFKYSGLVMAAVFAISIVLGILGLDISAWITQLGITLAISIPVIGLLVTMVILCLNRETKYAVMAIILVVVLVLTVLWRMSN